jgi:hypothetical protein
MKAGGSRRSTAVLVVAMLSPAAILGLVLAVTLLTGQSNRQDDPSTVGRAIPHTDVAPAPARAFRAATIWLGGSTTAATGEAVTVYVSPSLPVELGTPKTWADFLAGLVHGPELGVLTAYIAPLDEIEDMCGEYALGCYAGNQLAAIGETEYGITAAEVVRHEYGHHIALNRLNSPWPAVDWGPKEWSSVADVCQRAAEGSAYPGDEGDHYTLNPGEAWAETYRLLDERHAGASGSGWQLIDSSFRPDDAALQAAEDDVLQPWAASSKAGFKHRFTVKGKRVWSIPISTPLDGDLTIAISLPRGGTYGAVLLDTARKRTVATALWSGATTKRISTQICGSRSLTLRVTQRGAYGRVVVTVDKP